MRYDRFQKIRKRQKDIFVARTAEPSQTVLSEELAEIKQKRGEMRDPDAILLSSSSPRASNLFPGEDFSPRWQDESREELYQRQNGQERPSHFSSSQRQSNESFERSRTPSKFHFENYTYKSKERIGETTSRFASASLPRANIISSDHQTRRPVNFGLEMKDRKGDNVSNRLIQTRHNASKPANLFVAEQKNKFERKMKFHYEEVDDICDEKISEAMNSGEKSNRFTSTYLPVARPYMQHDPPQVEDDFMAPDHIHLAPCPSGETRTDVSDMTGVTHHVDGRQLPSSPRYLRPIAEGGRVNVASMRSHYEYLQRPQSRAKTTPTRPRIEIDLTEFETIEEAVKSVRSPCVKKRYGLPYENTDFKNEDDGSVDSWGKAIVTSRESGLRNVSAANKLEPIDVEKLFMEHTIDMPTPKSHVTEVSDVQCLVKETLSADGDIIVDVSGIEPVQEGMREDPKKNESRLPDNEADSTTKECNALAESENTKEAKAECSPSIATTPEAQESSPEHQVPVTEDSKSLIDPEKTRPSRLHLVALKAQVHRQCNEVVSTSEAFITSSLESSNKFFKEIAEDIGSKGKMIVDGIGERLHQLDQQILPEGEMNNMLGVLDKDLQETSQKVPGSHDVVDFLGKQVQQTSCGVDRTLACGGDVTDLSMKFDSASIEGLMGSVRENYARSLANRGEESTLKLSVSNHVDEVTTEENT